VIANSSDRPLIVNAPPRNHRGESRHGSGAVREIPIEFTEYTQ
jgi:hypothetical protein